MGVFVVIPQKEGLSRLLHDFFALTHNGVDEYTLETLRRGVDQASLHFCNGRPFGAETSSAQIGSLWQLRQVIIPSATAF